MQFVRIREIRDFAAKIVDGPSNAYAIDPTHPLVHIAMAKGALEKRDAFLRAYGIARLPADPAIRALAAGTRAQGHGCQACEVKIRDGSGLPKLGRTWKLRSNPLTRMRRDGPASFALSEDTNEVAITMDTRSAILLILTGTAPPCYAATATLSGTASHRK